MNGLMEYKGYHAKIEYSAEDSCLVGKTLGINDTLVFEGDTVQEIEQCFHDSVDDYLKLCQCIGKAPDKEYKGSFNVRLSPELHKQAFLATERRNMTLNQFVSEAVSRAVQAG